MAGEDAGAAAAPAQQNGQAVGQQNKLSASQKKKLKQKQRKEKKKEEQAQQLQQPQQEAKPPKGQGEEEEEAVEIEYVSAPLELDFLQGAAAAAAEGDDGDEPMPLAAGLGAAAADQLGGEGGEGQPSAAADFQRILQHFGNVEQLLGASGDEEGGSDGEEGAGPKGEGEEGGGARDKGAKGDEDDSEGEGDDEAALSRKKRKLATRLKIAELKQACERPDVVEVWDVTAQDPRLLVHLKAYRNTVSVPRHWSQKRKYLQGKRGLEKPPFKLPEFIEATGIGEMRQAYLEKAEGQKMKQKARERMQPKMGKLDIDYQVLHDAFFKYQTKPKLSGVGEMYYEGKEFEASITHARPGVLSAELQNALGVSEGVTPPPWLINMQRYGPPPSYPSLKVPGLNAPIPPGGQFGYHIGGWGKPPVDELGRPLYGNVFSVEEEEVDEDEQVVDKVVRWGELESEEEESSDEEEEEDDEDEEERDETESLADGYASVASGFASSLPSGIETPSEVDLRKTSEAVGAPKQLYTVLEQQKAAVGAGTLMGSEHTYVIPGQQGKEKLSIAAQKRLEALRRDLPADVDVSIDPAELEGLDDAALKDLYEMRVQEQREMAGREDFSDMVAAKAAQQKRKAAEKGGAKDSKRFKF